jgi:hypothetical protein
MTPWKRLKLPPRKSSKKLVIGKGNKDFIIFNKDK